MLIHVDWYKSSGKWYTGGIVDVGEASLVHKEEFKQAIVDNQHELVEGWTSHAEYFVVTRERDQDETFARALFHPSEFFGLTKRKKEVQSDVTA